MVASWYSIAIPLNFISSLDWARSPWGLLAHAGLMVGNTIISTNAIEMERLISASFCFGEPRPPPFVAFDHIRQVEVALGCPKVEGRRIGLAGWPIYPLLARLIPNSNIAAPINCTGVSVSPRISQAATKPTTGSRLEKIAVRALPTRCTLTYHTV